MQAHVPRLPPQGRPRVTDGEVVQAAHRVRPAADQLHLLALGQLGLG